MPHTVGPNGVIDPATTKNLLQESTIKHAAEKAPFWFSRRFYVVVLLFLGNMNVVLLKNNLNIAIIEMTSKEKIIEGKRITFEPEYPWDPSEKGFILSAYAYGLPFSALGVPVINKLGGVGTVGTMLMLKSIVNLITPACLYIHFWLFFASRILLGVFDSICYMGSLEMLSRWLPVRERSIMMSFLLCGIYVGVAVAYPICGFIADRWGWRTVFYFSGVEGILWSSIFLLVVKNEPSKDKRISKKELSYLMENTQTTPRKQVVHPYKKILTSAAVWALCAGKLAYSWGITLLVVSFPQYVKDITGRNTDEVGIISSIPNFVCIFALPLAGFIMDYWQKNGSLKVTQIHKILMGIGYFSGSVFFVIASYSTNFILSMTCFVFIKFILTFNYLILQLVCLYMSPKHSSILAGISSAWYTVSVILVPNTVGFIVRNNLLEQWSKCFLLSAAVLFAGAIIFSLYGSSELQPWNSPAPIISDTHVNGRFKIENKTDFEA